MNRQLNITTSKIDWHKEDEKFLLLSQNQMEAIKFFQKKIEENLGKDENIIHNLSMQNNVIGDYLRRRKALKKRLHRVAKSRNLDERNRFKRGYKIAEFVKNDATFRKKYEAYLKNFEMLLAKGKGLPEHNALLPNYKAYILEDLKTLKEILYALEESIKYGARRPHKWLNLFVWSKGSNFGKKRFLQFLEDHTKSYSVPRDQYDIHYFNYTYSTIVGPAPELFFKKQEYGFLNLILEGASAPFNLKFNSGSVAIKKDNPLFIFIGNESCHVMLKKIFPQYNKEKIESRMLDLEVKISASLHFLVDCCLSPR